MKQFESTRDREHVADQAVGNRDGFGPLPRRISRKASSSSSAGAPAGIIDHPATEWSFGDAVNAGIHAPIARAHDGGELAGHAGAAVARAADSAGDALPGQVRRKFEASLGVDLSGVRVHTGAESAEAASSVAARAYAVGQDIHFGAGQYDPSSAAGQHLLAHEVAHTVQQRGAAPTTQYKLEVSAPGDACEVEADAAADAMVRGTPARVLGGGGMSLGRVVMRSPSSDLGSAADRGERVERGALVDTPPPIAGVTNVQDVAQGQRLYDQIEHNLPLLEDGHNAGNSYINELVGAENALVTRDQITQTEATRTALSTYLASAGEQARQLGDFQRQYQQCIVDFARIQAMIEQFQTTHPDIGGASNAGEAGAMGDAVVRGASGRSTSEMADRTRSVPSGRGGGAFGDAWNEWRGRRTALDAAARDIETRQRNASAQQHSVLAAIDGLQAGPVTREDAGDEARAAQRDVRAECERVKTWVRRATSAAGSRASSALTRMNAPGMIAAAVGEYADDAGDFLVDAAFSQELQSLETAVARADERQSTHAGDQLLRVVRSTGETWHANLRELMNSIEALQNARNEMRTSTDMTSRAADASGHEDVAVIVRFTGECDVFLAQTRATIGLGESEEDAAEFATTDRSTAGEMRWYEALRTYSRGQMTYQAWERRVTINNYREPGSAEGPNGANAVVTQSLVELRRYESIVSAFHARLARAAGLGDVRTSRGPAVADPSMRSATGDPEVGVH